jgi:hypothetical protein
MGGVYDNDWKCTVADESVDMYWPTSLDNGISPAAGDFSGR